jgi:predicted O-linked N-acetylglucosamine transferase (SPINDLY family)
MLGPAMTLGCCVLQYSQARIPALVLICVLAILSVQQEAIWYDSLSLFGYAVKVSPSAPFNHLNYGVALAGEKKFDLAAVQFQQVLALSPQNSQARDNLALLRKIMENRSVRP